MATPGRCTATQVSNGATPATKATMWIVPTCTRTAIAYSAIPRPLSSRDLIAGTERNRTCV
jgi:hypothetical protein